MLTKWIFRPFFDFRSTQLRPPSDLHLSTHFSNFADENHYILFKSFNRKNYLIMKVTGLNGKGKGKLGAEVYSINHGVQIRREYNGEVSNPSTEAQVSQRSRFKLASQMSAVLAPVLTFTRKGMSSPRNQFTKKNMPYFYGNGEGSQVTYENLQITPGSVPLTRIVIQKNENNKLIFGVYGSPWSYIDRIAFCAFRKMDTGSMVYEKSWIFQKSDGQTIGGLTLFDGGFTGLEGITYVFYAYGFKFNNDRAKAKYGSYSIANAADFAKLVANRALSQSDLTFTETRGVTLLASQSGTVTPTPEQRVLYLSTNGMGQIAVTPDGENTFQTDGGAYPYTTNTKVILSQVPGTYQGFNFIFLGWFNNGDQEPFSTESEVKITMNIQRDIIARWRMEPAGLE